MRNHNIKKTLKLLVTTTVLAGLASGINAWWCFAGFPVRIMGEEELFLKWQIIPMGAVHGAIIALITIGSSVALYKKNKILSIIFIPFVGYIAGNYSFAPLFWGIDPSNSFEWEYYWLLFTNFKRELQYEELWTPYAWFGLAASIYYLCLCVFKQLYNKRLIYQLLIGITSGILGSLWFWVSNKPWYNSLIHGTVWGVFVGYGIWANVRETDPIKNRQQIPAGT